MHAQAGDYKHMSGVLLFLVVVIFLATYLILTFYNPEFVQYKKHGHANGKNDQSVTMLWALGISLVIVFLLGLIWYGFNCYN